MKLKILIISTVALMVLFSLNYLGSKIKTHNQSIKQTEEISPIDDKNSAEVKAPRYLYIIVSPEVWEVSLQTDKLALPPNHDQFIHLAKEDQISHVGKKFWSGSDYFILKIETDKMIGRLVYETNPGGSNKYYHLYDGVIPLDSVVEATFVKSVNP